MQDKDFTYIINTTPEQYALLMYNASCLVGNSSSFIREAHLGIPAVALEIDSAKRSSRNVAFTNYQDQNILSKINYQQKRKYKPQNLTEMAIQANIGYALERLKPSIKQITF